MSEATSIYNFLRNIGGSVGVAFVTTLVSQRAQFHQARLVEHLTPFNHVYTIARQRLSELLAARGTYGEGADGVIYGELQRQSHMMAFNDAFYFLSVTMLVVLLLVFFMRRKAGRAITTAH